MPAVACVCVCVCVCARTHAHTCTSACSLFQGMGEEIWLSISSMYKSQFSWLRSPVIPGCGKTIKEPSIRQHLVPHVVTISCVSIYQRQLLLILLITYLLLIFSSVKRKDDLYFFVHQAPKARFRIKLWSPHGEVYGPATSSCRLLNTLILLFVLTAGIVVSCSIKLHSLSVSNRNAHTKQVRTVCQA